MSKNGGSRRDGRRSRAEEMLEILANLARDPETPAGVRATCAKAVAQHDRGGGPDPSKMSNEELAEMLQAAAEATKSLTEET